TGRFGTGTGVDSAPVASVVANAIVLLDAESIHCVQPPPCTWLAAANDATSTTAVDACAVTPSANVALGMVASAGVPSAASAGAGAPQPAPSVSLPSRTGDGTSSTVNCSAPR